MAKAPERTDVPPAVEGFERYVLTVDAQVPGGSPESKNPPAVFHRAGSVVSVHKSHVPGLSWRIYDPEDPYGPGRDLPPRKPMKKAES